MLVAQTLSSQVVVGTGNTTTNAVPFNSYWGYSYVQQIFPQTAIDAVGNITSLSFTSAGVLPTYTGGSPSPNTPQGANNSFRVYIGHTSKSAFSSTTDWIPLANMTLVYEGPITMPTVSGQAINVNLTTPFTYNNTDNLVIAIDENSPGYAASDPTFMASGYAWLATTGQTNRVLSYTSDTTNPNPASPPTGSRSNVTSRVILGGLIPASVPGCSTLSSPANLATGLQRNLTFTWTLATGATSYDVYLGTSPTPAFVANTTSLSFVPPAVLDANTTYYWQVVPKNAAGDAVGCATYSFTTSADIVYCTPVTSNGCSDGDVIARVVLNTLDNNSGTGCPSGMLGYSDYTSDPELTTTLQAGSVYNCTVYAGQWSQGYAAWIDYNDNGVFETNERIGYSNGMVTGSGSAGVLGSSATFPIVLACNPPVGQHRLRVRGMFSTNGIDVTPCENNSYGEVEDYIITITEPAACPQPSSLASSLSNGEYSLTWNIGCAETAWEVVIQDAGSGVPTGAGVAASLPYIVQAADLTPGVKEFYVRANCNEDGFSIWTGPHVFTAPACTQVIAPANGAVNIGFVNDMVNISWEPSPGATSYDVNWGSSPGSLVFIGNITNSSVNIEGLSFNETSYWQIVPRNNVGAAVGCEVWSFTTEAPPANDVCSGALSLDGLTSPVTGSTTGMADNFIPPCAFYSESPDAFYSITVPAGYTLTIGNTDTLYDSFNTLFYGSCESYTVIDCVDEPEMTMITWENETGSTQTVYWVQDGYGVSAGAFTLAWTLTPPPISLETVTPSTICADDREGAVVVVTGQYFTGTSEVTINGIPHAFEVISDTELHIELDVTTVSGPIVVTSDISTGTSAYDFAVVNNPIVAGITYSGSNVICVGDQIDMDSLSPAGTWSSSDQLVATVDADGHVLAVGPGVAIISYSVTDNGCTTSVTAEVEVEEPVSSTNPVNQVVVTGSDASFSVTATGDIASYQWMVSPDYGETWTDVTDNAIYSGATTNTLTISNTPDSLNDHIYMVHVGSIGSCSDFYSSPALLSVGDTGIVSHPENVTLCGSGNDSASFSVSTSGEVDAYQWMVDTGLGAEPISDGPFVNVVFSGSATSQLDVSGIDLINSGWTFSVLIEGPANSATSNTALLTVNSAPSITADPVDGTVCSSGSTTSFNVQAAGAVAGFQWEYAASPAGPFSPVANGTPAGVTYSASTTGNTSTLNVTTTAGTPSSGSYFYRATAMAFAPCTGAPSGSAQLIFNTPQITSQPMAATGSIGGSASFSVETSAASPSYQWQFATSAAGPFTNVSNGTPSGFTYSGATSETLNVAIGGSAAVSTQRYFRAIVTSGGCSVISNVAQLTMVNYCTPAPVSGDGNGITNFTMGTINNSTGAEPGYYGNYTALSTDVTQGAITPFSITYSTGYSYGTKIWIDLNKDGDFTDPGELVYTGLSTNAVPTTLSGTITIPATSALGITRLRIGGTDDDAGPSTPCYTGSWSSFEDYTVNILPAPPCSGTPVAGTATANVGSVCVSGTAVLSVSGYSTGVDGITLQWHNAATGPISGATSASYTANISSDQSYFVRVTCTESGGYADSNTVTINVNNPSVVSAEGGSVCGLGSATLQATGSDGSTLMWYDAATGGSFLGSGSTFETPVLNTTTTYYVSAANDGASVAAGHPGPASFTNGVNVGGHGILFTTSEANLEIESANVSFSGTGTLTFQLRAGTNGALLQTVTSPTVSGNGLSPVVVPLGISLPNAGNYTLLVTGVSGSVGNLGYMMGSFPYSALDGAFTITSGYWYASDPNLMYMLGLNVVRPCESPRVAVQATVTEAPELTLNQTSAVSCGGSLTTTVTITSNPADYDTYSWSPASGVTGDVSSGFVFSPAASTLYTLTASNAEGCSNSATVMVTVTAPIADISINPASVDLCATGPAVALTASGGTVTVLNEDFANDAPLWTRVNGPSSPPQSNWSYVSSPWTYGSFVSFSTTDGNKFAVVNADAGGSGSTTNSQLVSPVFSTVGLTSATLSFEQEYRVWSSGDAVVQVQISTDGGTTWNTLANYLGTQQGSPSATAPASVSLNSFLNQPNLRIRYNYVSSWGYEWIVDNIRVTGTQLPVWSPQDGLFTDSAATIPYTGQGAASVYALPASTTDYSATVTSDAGCSSTGTVTVKVTPSATFYADMDGDGYGDINNPVIACAPSAGVVANNTDCDDSNELVNPGATEIGYNLIDDDCDGSIDEGFPPKATTLSTAYCGTSLNAINEQIFANIVAGAQGYQWRVTTITGPNAGQVQFLDTPLRVMKLTQLPNYAFGATYKIEVAVYYAGFLQPYQESDCTVTTPQPVTQLVNCDATLSNVADIVYCDITSYVTGYRFRITDPLNPANTQTIDRLLREFRMNLVTDFVVQYNKTYNVEVALRNTDGTYLPFGPVCSVTTPLFPTTGLVENQCDNGEGGAYDVPSMNTVIYASSYPGAVAYGFRLTGPGLPGGQAEVVNPLRTFKLSDFAGMGLIPGASYNVNVRLIFNLDEPAGPYGKTCTITVPGGARVKEADFGAVAFPNPFADSFNLDITTSNNDKVSVKVYDMAGRLLEERTSTVSQTEQSPLGDRYPAGVYNVIVTQGGDVKTLRVIKR